MPEVTDNIEILLGDSDDEHSQHLSDYSGGEFHDRHPAIEFLVRVGREWPSDSQKPLMAADPLIRAYEWGNGYRVLYMVPTGPDPIVYRVLQLEADDKDDLAEFLDTTLEWIEEDIHGVNGVEQFDGMLGYEDVVESVEEKVEALVAEVD